METQQATQRQHIRFGRNYGQESDVVQDTAVTNRHHDNIKCTGRTDLDHKLLERELQRLANKDSYEAHYYDSL